MKINYFSDPPHDVKTYNIDENGDEKESYRFVFDPETKKVTVSLYGKTLGIASNVTDFSQFISACFHIEAFISFARRTGIKLD